MEDGVSFASQHFCISMPTLTLQCLAPLSTHSHSYSHAPSHQAVSAAVTGAWSCFTQAGRPVASRFAAHQDGFHKSFSFHFFPPFSHTVLEPSNKMPIIWSMRGPSVLLQTDSNSGFSIRIYTVYKCVCVCVQTRLKPQGDTKLMLPVSFNHRIVSPYIRGYINQIKIKFKDKI